MPQWQGWWCSFIIIYGSYICCLRFQPKSTTDIHWHECPHEFDQSHPPKERHMFQTSFHVIWTSHMTNGILTSHLTPYTCIHFTQDSTWSEPVTRSLTYTVHTRFHMIWTSHPITDIHISHTFLCDSDQNHQTTSTCLSTQSSSLHKSERPWKFWVISLTSLIPLQHTLNKLGRNKGSQVPGHNCNGGKRI